MLPSASLCCLCSCALGPLGTAGRRCWSVMLLVGGCAGRRCWSAVLLVGGAGGICSACLQGSQCQHWEPPASSSLDMDRTEELQRELKPEPWLSLSMKQE